MTKASLYTWLTATYPLSLLGVSSTPDNNGTRPTIVTVQPFGMPKVLEITAGYAKYYTAKDPHWIKIWNVTRGEYLWGRGWYDDWLEFSEDIPGTWQVNDEISNAVDGDTSKYAEVWLTTLPSAAIALEFTASAKDSTPSSNVRGSATDTDNIAYLTIRPLHATITTYLQGMCKITNSKFRYKIVASGADTFQYELRLLGYYTEVDIIPPTTSRIVSPKGVRIA